MTVTYVLPRRRGNECLGPQHPPPGGSCLCHSFYDTRLLGSRWSGGIRVTGWLKRQPDQQLGELVVVGHLTTLGANSEPTLRLRSLAGLGNVAPAHGRSSLAIAR